MSEDLCELLYDVPLFQGITPADCEYLSEISSLRIFPSRMGLMERGQRSRAIYVLLSGSVKVFVTRPGEFATLIGLLGRGEVLGEVSALDGLYHSASVSTMETCRFLYLEHDRFWQTMQDVPIISLNLARILARRLRRITDQFEAMASLDVPGRVVRQLLTFAHDYGQKMPDDGILIPLRLTQADLAGLTGASRERVNKTIAFHRRKGHLTLDTCHHFTLYDRQAMAQYHRLPWPMW